MKFCAAFLAALAATVMASRDVEPQRKLLQAAENGAECTTLAEAIGPVFGALLTASGFLPTILNSTSGTLLKPTDTVLGVLPADFVLEGAANPPAPGESFFDGLILHHFLQDTVSEAELVHGSSFTTAVADLEQNVFCQAHFQSYWSDTVRIETVLGRTFIRSTGGAAEVVGPAVLTCEGVSVIEVMGLLFSCADTHVDAPAPGENCPTYATLLEERPILAQLLTLSGVELPAGGTLFLPSEEALGTFVQNFLGKPAAEVNESDFTPEVTTAVANLLALHYSPSYVPAAAIPGDIMGADIPTLADAAALEAFCPQPVNTFVEIATLGDELQILSAFGAGVGSLVLTPDLALTCGGTIVHLVDHVLLPCVGFGV